MTAMRRRDFLKLSAAGAISISMPGFRVHNSASDRGPGKGKVLVVIFLRGGQDPLNTIVPYSDSRYYEIRPTIAIPQPGSDPKAAIALDKRFGLHPALAPLAPLFEQKSLAPILNVGSPHPTRSHFDAQDFMEYGAPGLRTVTNGWLNRYLQATADPKGKDPVLRAIAMQGLLPRSLRGDYPVLAVPRTRRRDNDVLDLFDELYGEGARAGATGMEPPKRKGRRRELRRDDPVVVAGQATIRALRRYQEIVAQDSPPARGVSYPRGILGEKLQRIAQVLKSGEETEIACADYNGWDHHAREGGTDGTLARMLDHLGKSLAAFAADLGDHLERTLILTMSEFGRTCRENGNAGSDHGHGGMMFAIGGEVRGGKVLGKWPGLEDTDMYEGRDLQATTDFRDVMAAVLKNHMGFKLPRDFFPDFRPGRSSWLIR